MLEFRVLGSSCRDVGPSAYSVGRVAGFGVTRQRFLDSGSEEGSYLRLTDLCITQLNSRLESDKEENKRISGVPNRAVRKQVAT